MTPEAAREPAFPQLLRAAVLGTQQAPRPVASGDAETDAAIAPRAGERPEAALLRAAAVLGTIERIGRTPLALEPGGARPAADDRFRRCGPAAASDLAAILAGGVSTLLVDLELLAEWLVLAGRFERRVPEELLPQLLARGAQSAALREPLRTAIDARGWWLAARNPRWTYAIAGTDDERLFDEAESVHVRAAALRRLRLASPVAARERLESVWATEQPADRGTLLASLEASLSPEDEPLLERALDDKRKDVRQTAARLLHARPSSAAAARAIARAEPLLRLERPLLRPARLVAELPDAYTPEMRRDGIEPKPARPGAGERAWWLEQSLARVPPAHWRARFAARTDEMFEAAATGDYAEAVVRGFALAIASYRDAEGLAALLRLAARDEAFVEAFGLADHGALPAEAREDVVRPALRRRTRGAETLLIATHGPWSLALSRDALDFARGSAGAMGVTGDWEAFQRRTSLFRAIASRIDPLVPNPHHGWPEHDRSERTRELVETLLQAIAFRTGTYEHLADGA